MPAFELSYAGVPFCLDTPQVAKFLNSNLPLHVNSIAGPEDWPGKNLYGIAFGNRREQNVTPRIGEYYYPVSASRWSYFRGIVGTEQKTIMQAAALGSGAVPQKFKIKTSPDGPTQGKDYSLETKLFMLPPRPLAVHADANGLWLIELVDERYYWQWRNADVYHPTEDSTWLEIITQLAVQLGITIEGSIPSVYLQPEPDSHFWTNYENAAVLLDAVAWNLGRTVVRNFDGTYNLQENAEAAVQVITNRGVPVRIAGGDIGGNLDGQFLTSVANAVLPQTVLVTFSAYILNDTTGVDGAPHFYNSRFTSEPRSSVWQEESYGDVYWERIALSEVGSPWDQFSGHPGQKTIRDTAKAFYHQEADAQGNANPINRSELKALALQIGRAHV